VISNNGSCKDSFLKDRTAGRPLAIFIHVGSNSALPCDTSISNSACKYLDILFPQF
jgi:hypothetical protein